MNKLKQAESLDIKAGLMSKLALTLRHEYLIHRGWDISAQMVGPSITWIYKKGEYTGICEYDALEHEEFEHFNND